MSKNEFFAMKTHPSMTNWKYLILGKIIEKLLSPQSFMKNIPKKNFLK